MTEVHSGLSSGVDVAFPARRIKLVDEIDHVHSFSVNGGVTDEQAWAEFLRFHGRIAFGHSRRIISIDGPPVRLRARAVWAVQVAASYVEKWATIAWRYTFGRQAVGTRLAMLKRSIPRAQEPDRARWTGGA